MIRTCLIIIFVSVIIGAMLPASPPMAHDPAATEVETAPLIVTPPRTDSYNAGMSSPSAVPGQAMTLDRGPGGHFYADAEVNGVTVRFLVDTGATGVALTTEDARRVGLPFFPGEFSVVGRGASGDVRGKLVTLDRVRLGGKSVDQVAGAIIEGGDQSLLGQSFLGRIGTIEMSGERMVIR